MARSAAERMREYRRRVKAAGLRPVRILLPDMTSRRRRAALRQQSLAISGSAAAEREMDFIEALQADNADLWPE